MGTYDEGHSFRNNSRVMTFIDLNQESILGIFIIANVIHDLSNLLQPILTLVFLDPIKKFTCFFNFLKRNIFVDGLAFIHKENLILIG